MTIVETYFFVGTDCTYPVTVSQTIVDGDSAFYALPETISSEPVSITVTYQYPDLTVTTLKSLSPTIIFVCPYMDILSNVRSRHGLEGMVEVV